MSHPGPIARVLDFVVEERRRALGEGRAVLDITDRSPLGPAPLVEGRYDGAWVSFSSLDGVDLPALGRLLAGALAPGATVVCVVPGARPLAPLLRRALRGTGGVPYGRGEAGRSWVSLARWREAFGGAFRWRPARALGVLLESDPAEQGEEASPRALAVRAALEHLVGTWPVFRGLGERTLLEGERR